MLAFSITKKEPVYISAGSLSFPDEDRDRVIYQSAHTVAGKRADLPMRELEAWDAAIEEDRRRTFGGPRS